MAATSAQRRAVSLSGLAASLRAVEREAALAAMMEEEAAASLRAVQTEAAPAVVMEVAATASLRAVEMEAAPAAMMEEGAAASLRPVETEAAPVTVMAWAATRVEATVAMRTADQDRPVAHAARAARSPQKPARAEV